MGSAAARSQGQGQGSMPYGMSRLRADDRGEAMSLGTTVRGEGCGGGESQDLPR